MKALGEHPGLPQLVERELADGQTDRRWRQWLAPQLTYGRHSGPARSDARLAAVAIVLYQENAKWHVPLTVRPTELRTHGGQVSFPGGAIEPDESAHEAAQRELSEELFANRRPSEVRIDWLGQLEPLLVFVSNVLVEPWLGVLREEPNWQPHTGEVQSVLSLSLEQLLSTSEVDQMTIRRGSMEFLAPRLIVEGHDVWGTTAVLLGELRGRLLRMTGSEFAE